MGGSHSSSDKSQTSPQLPIHTWSTRLLLCSCVQVRFVLKCTGRGACVCCMWTHLADLYSRSRCMGGSHVSSGKLFCNLGASDYDLLVRSIFCSRSMSKNAISTSPQRMAREERDAKRPRLQAATFPHNTYDNTYESCVVLAHDICF